MSDPSLIDRERRILDDLRAQAKDRASGESRQSGELAAKAAALEAEFQAARRELLAKGQKALAQIERKGEEEIRSLDRESTSERAKIQAEYEAAVKAMKQRYQAEVSKAKTAAEESRWQATAVFESGMESVKRFHEIATRGHAEEEQARLVIASEAETLLKAHRKYIVNQDAEAPAGEPDPGDPRPAFRGSIEAMDAHVRALYELKSLKFLRLDTFAFLVIFLGAALAVPGALVIHWPIGAIGGAVVAVLIAGALRFILTKAARKAVTGIAIPLEAEMARAARLSEGSKAWIVEESRRMKQEAEERRAGEVKKADDQLAHRLQMAESRREAEKIRIEATYPKQLEELARLLDESLGQVRDRTATQSAESRAALESARKALDATHQARIRDHAQVIHQHWLDLSGRWAEGSNRLRDEIASIHAEEARLFPEWTSGWTGWAPPREVPPVIRVGRVEVDPATFPHGTPADDRLKPDAPGPFTLPALLDFREKGSLLIRAGESGRDEAVELLQAVMLRMLTAIPPSKVRFTIVDPVGLGRSFASFMHLADFDEAIINHRIWTDPQQIDQRLKDLTDHMENVIQTYLRNDYPTIEDYNAQAGEVAEPYRILVVANFPAGFSESAMKSLSSIVSSGARCGVHCLISVDTRAPMPFGFSIKDLDPNAVGLVWKDGRFVQRDPAFEALPFVPDRPPSPESITGILHEVGKISKEARRVEVPFEVIAPADDRWWTTDSRSGIDVPLGRAGATKLQNLKLGKGTSQHVLIAGKTGSGKSTLLHALITNVALRYSPKEVELYLIDFKKGVEFKTYATHNLPHARVVAIESEREFGLSVLQRLDAELRARGEMYRAVGAQDVASYRAARPNEDLPRILLIVDEFQEFFIEDDKLAQESSLMLDRLVRQGRAFGIHVHLGSQTLSGAYSLARSTLGQMAVRVALQCSESDAHLILSEENSAARLLSRPGEAIYNDANGLVEGNHIFQVVWLGDALRESYLKRLDKLAHDRGMVSKTPQIVFEGNNPAILDTNPGLNALLDAPEWPTPPRSVPAWLGDAIAIKDPTAATFQPQSGSNLLLIGQQDESAVGVLSASILGLAAHHPPDGPGGARFVVFDGIPSDSSLAGKLARIGDVIPHSFRVGGVRALPGLIAEVADEVDRRRGDEENTDHPSIYVVVNDLTRFRDLRKSDDDFGFSGSFGGGDKPPSPAKQFVTILREGPAVNVHVLAWCDTMPNLNRTFDRQGLGEFEMRVLFQMSAADSSQLIDSPAAGRLGPNRALFFSEEQGRLEKFRPYGPPDDAWLASVKARFDARPRPVVETADGPDDALVTDPTEVTP